jgi:hypothetical protein
MASCSGNDAAEASSSSLAPPALTTLLQGDPTALAKIILLPGRVKSSNNDNVDGYERQTAARRLTRHTIGLFDVRTNFATNKLVVFISG